MKGPSIEIAAVEETDPDEMELDVKVKCPFCQRVFSGKEESVGDSLFRHLWKHHDDRAIDFMIGNMFVPENVKEYIFSEMGAEYVSWLIDNGEIMEE